MAAPSASSRFEIAVDADETVKDIATPQLEIVGAALAAAIPGFVPVVRGVMQGTYNPGYAVVGTGRVEVWPGSPFWHWIEFGTAYNPPYRPIQRAAESLGLWQYVPQ